MEIITHYEPYWTGFLWHDAKAIYVQEGTTVRRFPKTEQGYRQALEAIEPTKVIRATSNEPLEDPARVVARDLIRNHLRLKTK